MSLITDLEAKLSALGVAIEDEAKTIGALILNALETAGKGAENALVASIPTVEAAIKNYALTEVQTIANDPAFKNAVGSWKLGTAASLVLQAVERDFPALATLGKGLLQSAIETAVQGAFAAITTGNPILTSAKP